MTKKFLNAKFDCTYCDLNSKENSKKTNIIFPKKNKSSGPVRFKLLDNLDSSHTINIFWLPKQKLYNQNETKRISTYKHLFIFFSRAL